ncbi:MAG: glycosyltransferase [Siculibacillus sp.]|nr:glycosyltransferase [Siculibacillus sp.]
MGSRRPLRLLFTTRAFGGGGAERVWSTLADRFAARGDDVLLAIDHDDGPPTFADAGDPRIVVLGRNHIGATMKLGRLLRDFRPDVALAAISGSCVKLVTAALITGSRVPTIISYHGFQEYRTGRLAKLAYWGMPVMNRRAHRIVAVSDGLRRELVERWGADPAKTTCIHNPATIDLGDASATAVDLATRPDVVLAAGRLSPEKGVDVLIEAFTLVRRPDARLMIAGDGPDRGRLERRVDDLGFADRVTFLGHVADIRPLYRQARVLAVPSRTEAFGMVVVEALAHGLPIVATACAGPTEILEGGRFGRLVPLEDPASLAEGIDIALADPGDPAPRIARAAAFSLERGFDSWARLVDEAAGLS